MLKKVLIIIFIILLIVPFTSAWSIFDDPVKENTDHIYIDEIETMWNFNDVGDYYWYWVEFKVNNITSTHDIKAIVSFYDSEGNLVKNENITAPIGEPIIYGNVEDNLTLDLEGIQYEYSYYDYLFGSIDSKEAVDMGHVKIDIIDFTDNKLLYNTNESFNMDNFNISDDASDRELSENNDDMSGKNKFNSKSDDDYDFFKDTDINGDGVISQDELSDISFIFTEDSYWDGYSIEEIIQSEFDMADSNGDGYLTFDEFEEII